MVMLQNTLTRLKMIHGQVPEHTLSRLQMIHGNVTEHTIQTPNDL